MFQIPMSQSLEKIAPGTNITVEIRQNSGKKTYTGLLLPRSELFDTDIFVLKLESGYNIGIQKKKVVSVSVVKGTQKTSAQKIIKQNSHLPKVAVLSFGGTISSKIDYKTGGVVAEYSATDFVQMIPELEDVAQIEAKLCSQFMSEDATKDDWIHIASEVTEYLNRDDIVGVVVTHGTDTMHYSASAVSFMLGKLNKPVVFTGSQRSIDRGSSDAFENLLASVKIASSWDGAEVGICMHETSNDGSCIFSRGVKVRKMHTSRRDAFRPINEEPLLRVLVDKPDIPLEIIQTTYEKRTKRIVTPIASFSDKIAYVQVYPLITQAEIDFYQKQGYKGIVIGATALGHIPKSVLPALNRCVQKGMIVVVASQTLYGQTHQYVYSRLREESLKMGLVFATDLLPEAEFTKLGSLLSQELDIQSLKELFETNLRYEFAGEISQNAYLN